MAEAAVAQLPRSALAGRVLTREAGLYLLLFAVGAVLRLWALGVAPLSAQEAGIASGAWRLSEGLGAAAHSESPLLLHAQAAVFLILGSGDALARLVPALAGSLIVLLPYLVRRDLGRLQSLWAAGLLAVSPTLIFASRRLDGQIVVAAASLVLWNGLRRWELHRDRRGMWLIAGSLAVGLAAGREMYLIVSVFLAYFGLRLLRRIAQNGLRRELNRWTRGLPDRSEGLAALAFGAGLFLALATGLLSRPQGLQDAWDLVPVLGTRAAGSLLSNPIGLLVWYEPVVLVVAVAEAIALRDRRLVRFAAFWAAGVFLLQAPFGADYAGLPLMVIPLAILSGGYLARRTQELMGAELGTREAVLFASMLIVIGFTLFLMGAYAAGGGVEPPEFAVYLLIEVVAAGIAFFFAPEGVRAPAIATFALVVIGAGLMLRAGGRLNYGAPAASEPLLRTVTSSDLRNLAADVEIASLQRTAEPDRLAVALAVDEPSLRWYLRDFPLEAVGEGTPPALLPAAVVSEGTLSAEGYLGQRYRLDETWRAPGPWSAEQNLAWYLFGEPPVGSDPRDIILWIQTQETG